MENPRDSLSRTPSPFMRRPRSTDSNRLSDMEGEGVQGVGSFDPDYQVGFEDTVDTEGTRPPSPLLGPNSGRDAGSSSLRMEHYAPDAPGANAKGWIVEGRRARQVAEPIEYRVCPTLRGILAGMIMAAHAKYMVLTQSSQCTDASMSTMARTAA